MSADQAVGLGMCALKGDEDDEHWGEVHDVRGLFAARAAEDLLAVELLGCQPQGSLRKCLDSLPAGAVQLGGAWLDVLDCDGVSMGSYFVYKMTVTAARPSSLDSHLVDLSTACAEGGALPARSRWNGCTPMWRGSIC
ncbi:hypothetical protein AB0H76_12270 [Nocardia sp. NPDC050712]|uniref:hypothetical protein n=1 Tax=Nocardia sp. NPDC050712 TaxID=3155518 RepID=UPI0033EC9E76